MVLQSDAFNFGILTISDAGSKGERKDTSGDGIEERMIIDAFKILDPDYLGSRVIIKPKSKSLVSIYNTLTGFHIKTEIEKNHFAPTCCLSVKKSLFDQIRFLTKDLNLVETGNLWTGYLGTAQK